MNIKKKRQFYAHKITIYLQKNYKKVFTELNKRQKNEHKCPQKLFPYIFIVKSKF